MSQENDSPYDGPVGEYCDLPPMGNCSECRQGYAAHVLDKDGVCPRCKLERVEIPPNPIFETRPSPTMPENHDARGYGRATVRPDRRG